MTGVGMRGELDAAGITDPGLRAAYARARALHARHGRTYFLASILLPGAKRPYVHALYGFARHADDIVDDLTEQASADERARRFATWSDGVLADLDAGTSCEPVTRALLDTAGRWDIPHEYFAQFLDSMRQDLTVTGYATHTDLAEYMWGSAAVIGLQMLPILGRADESIGWDDLEGYAVALGTAFQLTNFLRDVAEDLRRGRVYLPQESLDEFGVDRDRLARGRVDEPIRNLLASEIERARDYYRAAEPGIELVHPTSRPCLRAAATLYGEILDAIEQADYDVFSHRVRVGLARRARVGVSGLIAARRARAADVPATPRPTASPSPWRSRTAGPRPGRTRSASR
jgi:phytoene synthase